MNRVTQSLTFACAIGLLAGCQTPSSVLWSEAAATVPTESRTSIVIDPDIEDLIDFYLVKPDGTLYRQASLSKSSTEYNGSQSLYWTVDVSRLIANPGLRKPNESAADAEANRVKRRDKIADVLLTVADHNHEMFFNRVFRTYRTLNTGRNMSNTIFAGSTAVTALFSGPAAAGVAAANLAVDSVVAEANASYFLNQTFDAIDSATASERTRVRGEIKTRLQDQGYSVSELLTDAEKYSGISSFRSFGKIMNDAGRLKQKDNEKKEHAEAKSITL